MVKVVVDDGSYKIEYDKSTTKDEIFDKLRQYMKMERIVTVTINDCKICNDSKSLKEDIERAFSRLDDESYEKSLKVRDSLRDAKDYLELAKKVRKDVVYKRYLGLVSKYCLNEKKEEFVRTMIMSYGDDDILDALELVACIVIELDKSDFDVKSQVFNSVFSSKNSSNVINMALDVVREYTVYANKIDEFIFADFIDSKIDDIKEDIKSLKKQSKELREKYKF